MTGVLTTRSYAGPRVDELKLNLNQLTGTIPPELATNKNLSKLTSVVLMSLCSTLKLSLTLVFVELLYLGNNQLSGIIPEIFDHMTQLGKLLCSLEILDSLDDL